jgi:predicted dinucleotide-utilizing enzyme
MPRAKAPDPAPPLQVEDETAEAILRLAAVQSACIALSDAAAHLRRTSMLVEAASAAALARSLKAGPDDRDWVLSLEGAERTMQAAVATFVQTSQAAAALAAGGSGGEPA